MPQVAYSIYLRRSLAIMNLCSVSRFGLSVRSLAGALYDGDPSKVQIAKTYKDCQMLHREGYLERIGTHGGRFRWQHGYRYKLDPSHASFIMRLLPQGGEELEVRTIPVFRMVEG